MHLRTRTSLRVCALCLPAVGAAPLARAQTCDWLVRTAPPGHRYYHAMVYDTVRHVSLLFGGDVSSGYSGQTWAWNGSSWTLVSSSGPSPRDAMSMAFHSSRGVAVLQGGQDGFVPNTQTWEWNGSAWTMVASGLPGPRSYAAMA